MLSAPSVPSAPSSPSFIEVDLGSAGASAPRVLLMDSISQLGPQHEGAVIVSGSHGGVSAAGFALPHRVALVVFNDAGVGKDGAGIAALQLLQARGTPAATVSHASARIGEAADTWTSGVVSHVNEAARACGMAPGRALQEAVREAVRGAVHEQVRQHLVQPADSGLSPRP